MDMELASLIVGAMISLVGANGIIQFLIRRHDEKKGKLASIEKKLDKHIEQDEKDTILTVRVRILRFSDDIRSGVAAKLCKGSWDQCLEDIDTYNKYCDEHPGFKNGIATAAERLIMEEYSEHLRKNDFIA